MKTAEALYVCNKTQVGCKFCNAVSDPSNCKHRKGHKHDETCDCNPVCVPFYYTYDPFTVSKYAKKGMKE